MSSGTGSVTSLASAGDASFYPALNTNTLYFKLFVPRFGLELESTTPVMNRAQIGGIPPYNAIYELDQPVQFAVAARSRSLLSRLAPGKVDVETCKVKLIELRNLQVELERTRELDDRVSFEMTVTNRTSEERVRVTWMVWPMPAAYRLECAGSLVLKREPKSVNLSVPRAILAEERWLAFALTEPFHTDAAVAVIFPALDQS